MLKFKLVGFLSCAAFRCALVIGGISCESNEISTNQPNPLPIGTETNSCATVGVTDVCACLDGRQGTHQCLPDLTWSACFCDTEIATGGSVSTGGNPGGNAGNTGGTIVPGGSGGGSPANTGGIQAEAGSGGVSAGTGGGGTGGEQPVAGNEPPPAGTGGEPIENPQEWKPPAICSSLPPLPTTVFTKLDYVLGSEDFTFDNQGHLVGVTTNGNELFRVPYNGTAEMLAQNVGTMTGGMPAPMWVRGIRFLLDGNLVFADAGGGSLVKMNMQNYSKQTLISGVVSPNGVVVDMKGFIYLTEMGGRVFRVDPNTGDSSILFSEGVSLDGIAFSPDYKTLYINSEAGYVSSMPIHDDGTSGEWTLITQIMGQGGFTMLDGLTTDECGNVYVVVMSGSIMRVSPDGTEQLVVQLPLTGGGFGPGGSINAVNFGSGIGGWKADALYVISMMGGLYEIPIGVKGAPQPHL